MDRFLSRMEIFYTFLENSIEVFLNCEGKWAMFVRQCYRLIIMEGGFS